MPILRYVVLVALLPVGCASNLGASVTEGGVAIQGGTVVNPGPTPPMSGNGATIALQTGTYKGDLVISGNSNTVQGAGPAATILDGRLVVTGNLNRVSGIRVLGATQVAGNANRIWDNEYAGGAPQISGTGNTN